MASYTLANSASTLADVIATGNVISITLATSATSDFLYPSHKTREAST
jgi:hypothetical protein